ASPATALAVATTPGPHDARDRAGGAGGIRPWRAALSVQGHVRRRHGGRALAFTGAANAGGVHPDVASPATSSGGTHTCTSLAVLGFTATDCQEHPNLAECAVSPKL